MGLLKEPMLATSDIPCLYKDVTYPKYLQPKLDGIRCVAINGQAFSRKMKLIPNQYVQKIFAEHGLHGWDGELMVRGDFNDVQSAIMRGDGEPDFVYNLYDYWDSGDTYDLRKQLLECFEREPVNHIALVPTRVVNSGEQAEEILEQFVKEGYEGGMLRDINGKYKQGRATLKSQTLLKLKSFTDDEAVIVGFYEKMTNTNEKEKDERGYSKRSQKKEGLVGANTLGGITVRWKDLEFDIGSGFNDAQRADIWSRREELLGAIVTFKYQGVSAKGVPRFGIYKGIRLEYMQ